MNEEILAGLKGALERGFQLEDAIQSFINAGYNSSEVRESASLISKNFSLLPSTTKEDIIAANVEKEPEKDKEKSSRAKWIILVLAILIILGIAISMLLFKESFLNVIDSIFP